MRHIEALRVYTVLEMPRSHINAKGQLCVRAKLEGVIEGRPAMVILESTQPAVLSGVRPLRIGESVKLFGRLSKCLEVCSWAGKRRGVYRLDAYAISLPKNTPAMTC